MKVIGRNAERKVIHSARVSSDPELVAVWGPHRVGKTCLVRYCRGVEDHFLEVTGQRDAPARDRSSISSMPCRKPFIPESPWTLPAHGTTHLRF